MPVIEKGKEMVEGGGFRWEEGRDRGLREE